MNYELAKRLKDAGWKESCLKNGMPYYGDTPLDLGILPPLSELIEACGDIFPRAQFSLYGRAPDRWEATRVSVNVFGGTIEGNITEIGLTPEIAVSNLWIALHERK